MNFSILPLYKDLTPDEQRDIISAVLEPLWGRHHDPGIVRELGPGE